MKENLNKIKKLINLFLPPIFLKLKKNKNVIFKTYKNYDDAVKNSNTYENDDLVKVIASKGLQYKNFLASKNNKDLANLGSHQISKLLSLISNCEMKENSINILDFGGGAGHHYFLLKKLLNENITINWVVFETEELVKKCKELGLENPELKFTSNFRCNLIQNTKFDVLYANYSLAYTNEPYLFLQNLLELNFKKFYITNTALNDKNDQDVVGVQKSDLATNGVGRTIPTNLKLRNKTVFYPFTVMSEKRFENLLNKYTTIVFKVKEEQISYVTDKGSFSLFGYLLTKL